jgi:hypothetical protein
MILLLLRLNETKYYLLALTSFVVRDEKSEMHIQMQIQSLIIVINKTN